MNDLAAIKVIKLEPGERTVRCLESYGCVAFRCDWELSRIEDTCQFLACCGVSLLWCCDFYAKCAERCGGLMRRVAVRMPVYQSVEII